MSQPVLRIYNNEVWWTCPSEFEAFERADKNLDRKKMGLIKCLVVPPRGNEHIPVVPVRDNSRLVFPLCRKCCKKHQTGRFDPTYFCKHFKEEQRAFLATIPRPELILALENGYSVRKIYRCYAFEKSNFFK